MEKFYNKYSFYDYPPTEILEEEYYKESIKNLSFQYRTREGDDLIAFIALKQEQTQIAIPNIQQQSKGCRILQLYVRPLIIKGFKVDNAELRVALLDEAEFYINGWVDIKTNDFAFDYIWCFVEDIKDKEILEELGGMTIYDGIAYKCVKRICR